jgi:hypothetical protein
MSVAYRLRIYHTPGRPSGPVPQYARFTLLIERNDPEGHLIADSGVNPNRLSSRFRGPYISTRDSRDLRRSES